jgi:hypothetical protein
LAAHQQVALVAHLAGVRAAKDVYGTQDPTVRFRIGDANLSRIDVKAHRPRAAPVGRSVRRARLVARVVLVSFRLGLGEGLLCERDDRS